VLRSWRSAEKAFKPLVNSLYFEAARQLILARSYRLTDEDMLAALRPLLRQHGYLSGLVIDEALICPSSSAYASRFGSLLRTYSLIGYHPDRDYRYVEINKRLREMHPVVMSTTIDSIRATGASAVTNCDLVLINEEFTASIVLSRCRELPSGSSRWVIRLDTALCPDLTVAVRMNGDGETIKDYYILPWIDAAAHSLRLSDSNAAGIDVYRFNSLDILANLSTRVTIRRSNYGR